MGYCIQKNNVYECNGKIESTVPKVKPQLYSRRCELWGGHGSWDRAGKHVITWAFILEETCREYRSWLDKLQAEAVLALRKKDIVCEDRDKQEKREPIHQD